MANKEMFVSESAGRKPRIVLVGGSGQVGRILARHFHQRQTDVWVIARTTFSAPWSVVAWNGLQLGDWVKALAGADAVINLAGRSVDCRYGPRNQTRFWSQEFDPQNSWAKRFRRFRRRHR